jgi:hypothetical protein
VAPRSPDRFASDSDARTLNKRGRNLPVVAEDCVNTAGAVPHPHHIDTVFDGWVEDNAAPRGPDARSGGEFVSRTSHQRLCRQESELLHQPVYPPIGLADGGLRNVVLSRQSRNQTGNTMAAEPLAG